MHMNTIACPHCGKHIEISKALGKQIEQEIVAREQEKFKQELEIVKKEVLETSTKKLKTSFEFELKRAKEEAAENAERNKQLIEQITELTKELRATKKEKDEAKLEMQKQLAQEEEKIRLDATKKAEDEQSLKIREKDKQLLDTLKELEDAKRKLQQGSQQAQGEVFEQQFEELLSREFPNDKIIEVAKGVRGGDIIQEVWDRNGNFCGKILWELKNTKTWSEQWVDKLKTDQRSATADFAVLISEAVPSSVNSAKFYKNIWVTKQNFVIGLASSLRLSLIKVTMVKNAKNGQKEKTAMLYDYISSTEFQLRVEAIVEAFTNMQAEIEKEKRYFSNKWARDEKNIRQVIDNTYGMHGDLKGIMGNIIPQIKGLELLEDEIKG